MTEAYKYEPHSFKARRNSYKPVCERCGLIAINNTFTRWSIDKGCNSEDHPDYPRQRQMAGAKSFETRK